MQIRDPLEICWAAARNRIDLIVNAKVAKKSDSCKLFPHAIHVLPRYPNFFQLIQKNSWKATIRSRKLFTLFKFVSKNRSALNFFTNSLAFPNLFCTFVPPKNIYNYANRFMCINGPQRVGRTLLSVHPAAVSLAEIEVAAAGRSGLAAPYTVEASYVPSCGSKHYLPTIRAAVTALFSCRFGLLILVSVNFNINASKVRL